MITAPKTWKIRKIKKLQFLDEKGVSAPQKLGGFFKKMVSKKNDFSSKNTQKVQKYWKSKNGIKTALRPLFKELWAN